MGGMGTAKGTLWKGDLRASRLADLIPYALLRYLANGVRRMKRVPPIAPKHKPREEEKERIRAELCCEMWRVRRPLVACEIPPGRWRPGFHTNSLF